MKLKSFNYFLGLLIIFIFSHLNGEEKIDIWKNNKEISTESSKPEENNTKQNFNLKSSQSIKAVEKVEIQENLSIQENDQKVYGIFEPADFNFSLNMWTTTNAEDLRSSLKRLKKIQLSNSSREILESILFSYSYTPKENTEKSLLI